MTALQQALRLPDSMSRDDIGPYMRSLREHYGLAEQEVSDRLHIRVRYVRAIEEGQFDALPGKVYAKGYVHTYAEFLGLDPLQVAEICFGPELAREQQSHFVPEPARGAARVPRSWIWAGAIALALLGIYNLFSGGDQGAKDGTVTTQTGEVPESMLEGLRTSPMPTPDNFDCLNGHGRLACFYASRLVQHWVMPPVVPAYATFAPGTPQGDEDLQDSGSVEEE